MSNTQGITNTLEVIDFGIAAAAAFKSAKVDGKVDAADLQYLIGIVPKVAPAFADIGEVPTELKDLDSGEVEQIIAKVKELVGEVGSEKAVSIAEDAISAAISIYGIITKLND